MHTTLTAVVIAAGLDDVRLHPKERIVVRTSSLYPEKKASTFLRMDAPLVSGTYIYMHLHAHTNERPVTATNKWSYS